MQQILVNRINGLSNELAQIKLLSARETFLVREELDLAISYYNNFCYSAAKVKINNKSILMPYSVYQSATQYSEQCKKQMFTIGGFLLESN